MIGCVLLAFALCNPNTPYGGYTYVQPPPQQAVVYAQQPPQQVVYAAPQPYVYAPAPVYAYAPPVAVVPVIRFGFGGHRGRW